MIVSSQSASKSFVEHSNKILIDMWDHAVHVYYLHFDFLCICLKCHVEILKLSDANFDFNSFVDGPNNL